MWNRSGVEKLLSNACQVIAQSFGCPYTTIARAGRLGAVTLTVPGLATKVFPLASYFMNQSPLDRRVRELAVLMLMKRLNCEYGLVVGKGNVIDLTGAIAFWNMMARNLNALRVGLKS